MYRRICVGCMHFNKGLKHLKILVFSGALEPIPLIPRDDSVLLRAGSWEEEEGLIVGC